MRENAPDEVPNTFTPLLVIATDVRGVLIADALRVLPATRLHIVHARVQILYDQTQWGDTPPDVVRHRVMDAIGLAGIEFSWLDERIEQPLSRGSVQ